MSQMASPVRASPKSTDRIFIVQPFSSCCQQQSHQYKISETSAFFSFLRLMKKCPMPASPHMTFSSFFPFTLPKSLDSCSSWKSYLCCISSVSRGSYWQKSELPPILLSSTFEYCRHLVLQSHADGSFGFHSRHGLFGGIAGKVQSLFFVHKFTPYTHLQ